ncbi:hypothetical protein Tco_0520967 [Tanacetum coccineum]
MSTPIDLSAFAMNCLQIRNQCPYDLSKLLPLHESQGRLTVPADFFFNNDLEYLRGGSNDRKYTTSITKTKAVKYDIEEISHWGPKRQRFYGHLINKQSRHDVYSTKRILSVTSVTIEEWYGYGYLKEIVVRRADHKLYKFKEGDFPWLHLNDIEDMLLLVAQNKLNNLDGDVIVHLAVGLRIPQGVIYEEKLKRKIFMRIEELYKFSDGTLTSVRNTLDQMLKNLRLGYNKVMDKRKWIATDQKQTRIMIEDIDKQLLHRRIMRSL